MVWPRNRAIDPLRVNGFYEQLEEAGAESLDDQRD